MGLSLVGYIDFCGLLVLVLCEGLCCSCVVCGTEALFTVHNACVYVFVVLCCCGMCTCVCCEL